MNLFNIGIVTIFSMLVSCTGRSEMSPEVPVLTDRPTCTAGQMANQIVVDGGLEEWRGEEWISLSYRHLPTSDLSARAALQWDERCLYLACQVEDDRFNQPYLGRDLWRGDSVHLGFDPLEEAVAAGYGPDDLELVLALADGQPQSWFYHGPRKGMAGDVQLAIREGEKGGKLTYEAAIPWPLLAPLHPDSMRASGFTLSVNDNDGAPWEGFSYITFSKDNAGGAWKGHAQWGSGIFPQWDATQFGRLVFSGSAAGPGKPTLVLERGPQLPRLRTAACVAGDFSLKGRLVPAEQAFVATASLTVVNESSKPLKNSWLGFQLYPDIEVESVVDEDGRELMFEGPSRYEEDSRLMAVRLAGSLSPGLSQRLTFTYRGIFAGKVSNHIGADNSWLLRESCWFPYLGEDGDDLEGLRRQNRGPFTLEIAAPKGERVISAGELIASREGDQETTWIWRAEEPPFGFTSAKYEEVVEKVDGVSVKVWTYPEHREGARKLVEMVVQCLRFYEGVFGPYPDETFSIAEVERRGGYGSMPLLLNRRNFEQEPSLHLIAHELAHRWWGHLGDEMHNMHEGFAEYSAAVAVQALRGDELPLRNWLGKFRTAIGSERPLSVEQENYRLYRTVAYNKGPYVLHMLRYSMGEEPFFTALRNFYSRVHVHPEPPSLVDFEQICEQTSGLELGWFFDQWMRQVARPEFVLGEVSVERRKGQFVTTATVRNEGNGRMPVSVVLGTADGTRSREVDLAAGAEESLVFSSPQEPVWLEIDPDKWVLQSRLYDDRHKFGEAAAGGRISAEQLDTIGEAATGGRISAEQLDAIGLVGAGKTDEMAIRELVAFYQRPDLDVNSSVDLQDLRATARYFGMPAAYALQRETELREEAEISGQIPAGMEQEEWSITVAERDGQIVGQVRIPLRLTADGKVQQGRMLYLAARSNARWRFINFDMSM